MQSSHKHDPAYALAASRSCRTPCQSGHLKSSIDNGGFGLCSKQVGALERSGAQVSQTLAWWGEGALACGVGAWLGGWVGAWAGGLGGSMPGAWAGGFTCSTAALGACTCSIVPVVKWKYPCSLCRQMVAHYLDHLRLFRACDALVTCAPGLVAPAGKRTPLLVPAGCPGCKPCPAMAGDTTPGLTPCCCCCCCVGGTAVP